MNLQIGDVIKNVSYDSDRNISSIETLPFLGNVVSVNPYKVSILWNAEEPYSQTCPLREMNNFVCMHGDFVYRLEEGKWLDKFGDIYDDELQKIQ